MDLSKGIFRVLKTEKINVFYSTVNVFDKLIIRLVINIKHHFFFNSILPIIT